MKTFVDDTIINNLGFDVVWPSQIDGRAATATKGNIHLQDLMNGFWSFETIEEEKAVFKASFSTVEELKKLYFKYTGENI